MSVKSYRVWAKKKVRDIYENANYAREHLQKRVSTTRAGDWRRTPRKSAFDIDLGDVWSHHCLLNEKGEVVDRGRFRNSPKESRSVSRSASGAGIRK